MRQKIDVLLAEAPGAVSCELWGKQQESTRTRRAKIIISQWKLPKTNHSTGDNGEPVYRVDLLA